MQGLEQQAQYNGRRAHLARPGMGRELSSGRRVHRGSRIAGCRLPLLLVLLLLIFGGYSATWRRSESRQVNGRPGLTSWNCREHGETSFV